MPPFSLTGRTALVTGGTSGIGLALTHALVEAGARRVLVVARDAARLAAITAVRPIVVTPYRADLTQPAEVERLLRDVPIAAPDLSLVINNAGTQRLTDFVREDPLAVLPALRAEIAANLTGVVALSIGLLPLLARQPSRRW
jgi:short-subunit dehydrogenase involved in D-alanine esterification of teichoic acids